MDDRILQILEDSFTQLLIPGLTVTIPLTLLSFAFGLAIALVLAVIRTANVPVLTNVARVYVWIFRGTPLLVQLFVIFFGLPSIGVTLDAFPSAVIAFSLNVGAYASEAIRAAISAVPKGQFEAGYCVGMSYLTVMRRIVLPQAFRTAYPPLFNEFISLVKNTSLASSITVFEMFMSAQRIAARTYEPFWLYLEAAAIYLAFSTVLSQIQVWGEKRLAKYEY
ncbi:amino acid ABC transporter permease [Sutterella sp.]|uniref:amino acid ABC transporter permease n=1 Tax=Sutterella sp. TaxID=1981025 RepID=UPI0026DF1041|nr:amino acid ABC transporter permease [Sutterella sp.]MDO5532709.1 amino acid ABC transporter permease [Sutterella sp.]